MKHNVFLDHLRHPTSTQLLLAYAQSIMSASAAAVSYADMACCRCSPESTLSGFVTDQQIRDMRHQEHCKKLKGVVAKCSSCHRDITTADIQKTHLDRLRRQLPSNSHYFTTDITEMTDQRLAVNAMTYISSNLKSEENNLLFELSRFIFNEHSYKHRPSCFKKGCECRFHYPAGLNSDWSCDLFASDDSTDTIDSHSTPWASMNDISRCRGFTIIPKRCLSDIFINVHNPCVARWNGFNNNVQLGDPAHIFYNTLYTSKSAVDEDVRYHKQTLDSVLTKINKDSMTSSALTQEDNDTQSPLNDFRIGLGRLLVGITGHLHESVISPNLAAHIISTGTRFHFSHDYSHIVVRHFEDFFAGKTLQFNVRWSRENQMGQIDNQVFDYIHRHSSLEDICVYEFSSRYESISRHSASLDRPDVLEFDNDHPLRSYRLLKQRNIEFIPIIEGSNFADLHSLLLNHADTHEQEKYAKTALLLFFPFRCEKDLYHNLTHSSESLWDMFMRIREDSSSKFWKRGNIILQNQQDRLYNITRLKRLPDPIEKHTTLTASSIDSNSRSIIDDENVSMGSETSPIDVCFK